MAYTDVVEPMIAKIRKVAGEWIRCVRRQKFNPHISPVGADIAQQIWFHKGFSDRAEYQCEFPREENFLWEQRSSEIVSIW